MDFISLILTSLDYAIFAGDPASSYGRLSSEEPILGVGFAVSGALVIYAIILTLDAANHVDERPSPGRINTATYGDGNASHVSPDVGESTRHLLAMIIPPLLFYYIFEAIQVDYDRIHCNGTVPLDDLGWSLLAAQIVTSFVVYPALVLSERRAKSPVAKARCALWVSRILLTITFTGSIAFAVADSDLQNRPPSYTLSALVPAICLVVIFLAMLGMTWQLAYTGPPRRVRARSTSGHSDRDAVPSSADDEQGQRDEHAKDGESRPALPESSEPPVTGTSAKDGDLLVIDPTRRWSDELIKTRANVGYRGSSMLRECGKASGSWRAHPCTPDSAPACSRPLHCKIVLRARTR
jgi:hypothetical protein